MQKYFHTHKFSVLKHPDNNCLFLGAVKIRLDEIMFVLLFIFKKNEIFWILEFPKFQLTQLVAKTCTYLYTLKIYSVVRVKL